MRQVFLIALAAVVTLVTSQAPASAQTCTATISAVNFGTVDLTLGSVIDVTANLELFCSGLPGQTVRSCPSIGPGTGGAAAGGVTRYMTGSLSGQIGYNLFQDSNHSTVWGTVNGSMGGFGPPAIDVALNLGGAGGTTRTIHARIFAGQQSTPTGTFNSTFLGADVSIATGYAIANPTCAAIGQSNATTTTFTANAVYPASCTISASGLNFGAIASTSASTDASASLTTRCSSATPYTLLLNGGLTGAANPLARQMQSGANLLTYALYQDSNRTQPWGATIGSNVLGGTGTGSNQSISVYGRVPQQPTPPVGSYADTVIVTIDY